MTFGGIVGMAFSIDSARARGLSFTVGRGGREFFVAQHRQLGLAVHVAQHDNVARIDEVRVFYFFV